MGGLWGKAQRAIFVSEVSNLVRPRGPAMG